MVDEFVKNRYKIRMHNRVHPEYCYCNRCSGVRVKRKKHIAVAYILLLIVIIPIALV